MNLNLARLRERGIVVEGLFGKEENTDMEKRKNDKRVALYLDEETVGLIQAKQAELHRQGLGSSLSKVLGLLIRQGLQQPGLRL